MAAKRRRDISGPMNIKNLVAKLNEPLVDDNNRRRDEVGDRRTVYVASISSTCALALAGTSSYRSAPILRTFLHWHLLFRSRFVVTLALTFSFEFHICFFALRRGNKPADTRKIEGRPLRVSRSLPLARNAEETTDVYCESQSSVLVNGVDEWVWTGYCLVDTYYGCEAERMSYLSTANNNSPREPASGGTAPLGHPIWNPREYFLVVLSRRIRQATLECGALIDAFEERMVEYEEKTLFQFIDEDLSHTQELTLTVSTLRRFRNTISMTIEAWEILEQRDITTFEPIGFNLPTWQERIGEVREYVDTLKSYQTLLTQRLDSFNNMRDGMVNASALKESAVATTQGNYITLLTGLTVFSLPLPLSTGIFSMTMVPNTTHWKWFALVLISLMVITLSIASYIEVRRLMPNRKKEAEFSTRPLP